MKKLKLRIFATCLAIAMLLPIIAGCRRDTNNFEPPEFVFVAETLAIQGSDIENIQNPVYFDNTLYFWSPILLDEVTWSSTAKLFSMDIDGTNLIELPNYNPGEPPYPDANASFNIMQLVIDDGYIWVVEFGVFYRFNIPDDFDGEDYERWDYREELGNEINIRKLDSTGAEVNRVDLDPIAAGSEWFQINAFNVDSSGNIYIGSEETIFVLNSELEPLFQLDVDWAQELFRLPDGNVAHFAWAEEGRVLRTIDAAAEAWGYTITLPSNAQQIFLGNEEYILLFQDGSGLFGIETETEEVVRLASWLDSGLSVDHLDNAVILDDGRILSAVTTWGDRFGGAPTFELMILTKVPYSDLPERTMITLATVWPDPSLRNYILEFNRTNPTYRVHVIDYSEYNTDDDWDAGIVRLSTDIIAGRIPDIIDLSGLPFEQYAARGLLVDLYPFIDSDPELSRDNFMENVLRASELDGGLYRIFMSFAINTLVGHPSVVGPDVGWTMDEFLAVLDANPQADMPLGQWLTRYNFLEAAITVNMSEYVDWAAGETNFDTPEFAQLLELATRFPEDFDIGDEMGFMREESNLIAEGRQLMAFSGVWSYHDLLMHNAMFDGDVVFKGFPAESGNGNSINIQFGLAITTQSSNQDAAWQFLRGMLMADWQIENIQHPFPTNRTAFDARIEEALAGPDYQGGMSWGWGQVDFRALTQDEVDQFIYLVDTTYNIAHNDQALMGIINENVADFFAGRQNAAETARIIQDRVSRYIQEQS